MSRFIALAVVTVAAPCLAEDVEIFTDRQETYVRAGADHGLQRGTSLTVLAAKGGKPVGTAMVMETWPALARVNLDDAARNAKGKYVQLGAAAAPAAPAAAPSPPPPPPAAATAAPAAEEKRTPAAPAAAPPGTLKGRAVYGGAGPWTALQVINESDRDWNDCQVTMMPMSSSYHLKFLRAQDHELIGRSNFTNHDFSGDPTSAVVRCREGAATFPIK